MNKTYWEQRYADKNTSWDVGYAITPIKIYIDQLTDKELKILIPGAGNGHEAAYLHAQGFSNITVVDIAEQPIQNLLKRVPDFPKSKVKVMDFFDLEGSFDLILEHTFFCALAPDFRTNYVQKMFDLLEPNGKLVGLLFDIPLTENGPPFGGNETLYKQLFAPHFNIHLMETAHNSIKPRKERELFFKFSPKK